MTGHLASSLINFTEPLMIVFMLKKLPTVLTSAVLLSAGVAYGATPMQPSTGTEGASRLAQATCVTEVDEYPTSDADVDYVTEATTCFTENDGITIGGEVFAIEYDSSVGYYYVVYNGVRWYFVEWDGVILLTDGDNYVEFDIV